jgi:aminopeptidase N
MKLLLFATLILLSLITLTNSCGIKTPQLDNKELFTQNSELDSLSPEENILSEPNVDLYVPSRTILTDLIHTKLEISFDWNKKHVFGTAFITAKPHFYKSDSVYLDAQFMDIKSITLAENRLEFSYLNNRIGIKLDKKYTKDESFTLKINYTAKPNEFTDDINSENKGMYFINTDSKNSALMPQIWTQGETQANSVWFPTIDSPNSKSSQEMFIRVDKKYKTLSNGKLISSELHQDGTRTDHWKQELPHSTYLFMLAVGEFKCVKDNYKKADGSIMDVNYYVEPEWEKYAKAIFGETPKMIAYFSKITGVDYPWDKYSQIVVRDYISGAMENTGAVVFGDYVYKTDRELLDNNDQSVIAHELFHHWFGDLVTCESWANLPLNESFANYAQYLWDEHRYGKYQADLGNEIEVSEFKSAYEIGENHNLIWYNHPTRDAMFDKHSYNKGGRVLHMLRSILGDDAFFMGLKKYLTTHKFKSAEIHDLRLAFEEVSGQDLNWFFNQWFLGSFIPELTIDYYVSKKNQEVVVTVTQEKDAKLFRLPVTIFVYDEAGTHEYTAEIDELENKFVYPIKGKLKSIVFDPQDILLAYKKEIKDRSYFNQQYYLSNTYASKRDAILYGTSIGDSLGEHLILDALKDPFWKIRELAIDKAAQLSDLNKKSALKIIVQLMKTDSSSYVRLKAVDFVSNEDPILLEKNILYLLEKDQSYLVLEKAMQTINIVNPIMAEEYLKPLENDSSSKIKLILSKLYSTTRDIKHFSFYSTLLEMYSLPGYQGLEHLTNFTVYISTLPFEYQQKALKIFENQNKFGTFYTKMYLKEDVDYLISSIKNTLSDDDLEDKGLRSMKELYINQLNDFINQLELTK